MKEKKDSPKTPPAYQLTHDAYQAVLIYWLQQLNLGRDIGKIQAMNELILDGAGLNSNSTTPRKAHTNGKATVRA